MNQCKRCVAITVCVDCYPQSDAAKMLTPLVWTDAKPTVPGVLYLWRYDSMSPIDDWEIVETCLDNKFGIVRRRGSFSYAFPDGQFAGPIPMPVEPTEEGN